MVAAGLDGVLRDVDDSARVPDHVASARDVQRDLAAALLPRAATVALGVAATLAVLAVVPIPDGPARLTLPTFIEDVQDVTVPGRDRGAGRLDPRQHRQR